MAGVRTPATHRQRDTRTVFWQRLARYPSPEPATRPRAAQPPIECSQQGFNPGSETIDRIPVGIPVESQPTSEPDRIFLGEAAGAGILPADRTVPPTPHATRIRSEYIPSP